MQKVSDADNTNLRTRENIQSSAQSQVPAQDYERDILPRYKEALHIGLDSCKDHFRRKGRSTTSVFRAMSTYSPLPHIIGSEEYNHDNSCGLADDAQTLTDDFSWLREFQGEPSDSGHGDLFGSQMLGAQQDFEKGETDSLVSASRQFKAMLEAALVNPSKFYDDVSSTAQNASVENTNISEVHHNTDPAYSTRTGEASGERSTKADNTEDTQLLASLQDPDVNVHDLYAALVREGLFDAGDEILAVGPASEDETIVSEPQKLIEGDHAASPSGQKDSAFEST